MGEDLSNKILDFGCGPAVLFWNLEDYPIPTLDIDKLLPIYDKVRLAISKMGDIVPEGDVRLGIFGDVKRDIYRENQIFYKPSEHIDKLYKETSEVGENTVDWNMALEIVTWIVSIPELNIFVLAKQKEDSEVYRVLQILKSMKYNVFLLTPAQESTTAEHLFRSLDSIVASTQVYDETVLLPTLTNLA